MLWNLGSTLQTRGAGKKLMKGKLGSGEWLAVELMGCCIDE